MVGAKGLNRTISMLGIGNVLDLNGYIKENELILLTEHSASQSRNLCDFVERVL